MFPLEVGKDLEFIIHNDDDESSFLEGVFFFRGGRDLNLGLMLARKAFYCLSHSSSPSWKVSKKDHRE
jgi:hypothetical protein